MKYKLLNSLPSTVPWFAMGLFLSHALPFSFVPLHHNKQVKPTNSMKRK